MAGEEERANRRTSTPVPVIPAALFKGGCGGSGAAAVPLCFLTVPLPPLQYGVQAMKTMSHCFTSVRRPGMRCLLEGQTATWSREKSTWGEWDGGMMNPLKGSKDRWWRSGGADAWTATTRRISEKLTCNSVAYYRYANL